ncbi:MAG TPA: phosphoribosylglycinamide formyltransferase [Vicinamibacteria bacterium]|nr:phosphoribosylglycinamide formyltransferase [Vicinamibacteria bacterium]
MKSIGVLISGRGSNLQALIDAQKAHRLGGRIAVVVSNVAGAAGLERARAAGIATEVVEKGTLTREEHDRAVIAVLRHHLVELVCLAGYMRLLSPEFVRAYAGRILNVHPSLLPAFPGREAARQAVEHGVKVSGATIHFVDEQLDAGPILLQQPVAVADDDDAERLAARILEVEHALYPRAVRLVLDGRFRLEGRRVKVLG